MIISLVQALYDPRIPIPRDDAFYEQALEDIEFFAVSSQLYYLLKQQGQLALTPLFFQERLRQKYDEALYLNIFIKNQMQQLFSAFEDIGLCAIPLKGTRFAEKYFGHIGARGTTDIDLLIKPNDVKKAVQCVKSLGYTLEQEHIRSHFHWSFSKKLPHGPIPLTVELHWDFLVENTSNLQIHEFWEQAAPLDSYNHIKELSDVHTFYSICLHGWRHHLNSIKYFLDIIQLIHSLRDRLNYESLWKDAAAHQTLKRITRTLVIVYNQFPHLETIKALPLHKKTGIWWDYNAIRGLKERTLKQYFNLSYFQLLDYDTGKHSVYSMIDWIRSMK